MLLADVVATLAEVSATRSRLAKVAAIAGLLRRLEPEDVPATVGLLLGRVRQGRIGIGWRTVWGLRESGEAAPGERPRLTVAEVDEAFHRIADASGPGSAAARHTALVGLLRLATETEQEFLGRVLTGEVRTGALEGVLVDAVAAAAEQPPEVVRRAVMLSGDLGATVRMAMTEPDLLAGVGLTVMTPVQPMLASTAADVAAALEVTGEASVEYKLDGARIQVHRRGDQVRIFTRSLADVTHRLPDIVEVVRGLPVDDVILDGETLLLDEDGAPRPFQETMSHFGAERARAVVLRPWFFDVLHVDGADLIDQPLTARREALSRVVGDLRVPGVVTADPVVAEDFAREALAAGHEGVLAKATGSVYAAGRRGKQWVKVKPVHTYDLVVLGVEWGSGRRQGWLSNLHLGARDPEGEYGEPGGFVMVGKTFKGLTDELLRWQTEHFPTIETRSTRHAVFVRPETVVEIALDGVQRSSRYPGGIALRFARVKRYRPDKVAADADTVQTLRGLLLGGPPG